MASKFAILICFIGYAFLAGCASHGSSVHGQVYEVENPEDPPLQWRKTPSSGTFVIVRWRGTVPRPIDATSVCLHTSIAKTDAHGHFTVPGWWAFPKLYPVIEIDSFFWTYKPGYQQPDLPTDNVAYLKTEQRSAEDRLAFLGNMSDVGCWNDPAISDTENNLGGYYRALYEEARQLEVTSRTGKWSIDKIRQKVEKTPNNNPAQ